MTATPAPRPALRKAADAHIHPAAPGHPVGSLRPAAEASAAPGSAPAPALAVPESRPSPEPSSRRGASGPLRGTTSDGLRAAAKASRQHRRNPDEKLVDLSVKVPKALRKQFRAAAKVERQDPDAVVASLLRAWLGG